MRTQRGQRCQHDEGHEATGARSCAPVPLRNGPRAREVLDATATDEAVSAAPREGRGYALVSAPEGALAFLQQMMCSADQKRGVIDNVVQVFLQLMHHLFYVRERGLHGSLRMMRRLFE